MQRKCEDGLISGVRILIMEKRVLKNYSISSHVVNDGKRLYVTYDGQNFICNYCGNVDHKLIDCNKRATNFLMFIQNQALFVCNPNFSNRQYDDLPTIRRQKVVQLLCNDKVCDKKSNTSNESFSENI